MEEEFRRAADPDRVAGGGECFTEAAAWAKAFSRARFVKLEYSFTWGLQYSFLWSLNHSGHNWSDTCTTQHAVPVDQPLAHLSLLKHNLQNSTHLSHGLYHNLHNTVDFQHFDQMLTHCCHNCKPHIQNRMDFILVHFKHCGLQFQLKHKVSYFRLVSEKYKNTFFWKWTKEERLVEGEEWQWECGCVEDLGPIRIVFFA